MRPAVTAPALRDSRTSATASACGTFGELLQGVLPGSGRDFLVTLPINRRSTATVTVDPEATSFEVFPEDRKKSQRIAEDLLARMGLPASGSLRLHSELPVGKGFASSSADLVATVRALGRALALDMSEETIASLLREVEPTDGVMYPGVVAFYHREVRLREVLGPLPPTTIVAVDEGGEVDTIEFNKLAKPFSDRDRGRYAELLDTIGAAVQAGDLATVGRVATESAYLNQQLRPKRTLDRMSAICDAVGGLGVAVAHSGTAVGILLADDDPAYLDKVTEALGACRALTPDVTVYHTEPADGDWPSRTEALSRVFS